MEPRPAPWRVFDQTAAATDDGTTDGSSASPEAQRDGLTLPVAWTAAAIVLVVAAVAVVGFLLLSAPHSTVALPDNGSFAPVGSAGAGEAPGPIGPSGPVVEVSGAVVHPGVYHLASGRARG